MADYEVVSVEPETGYEVVKVEPEKGYPSAVSELATLTVGVSPLACGLILLGVRSLSRRRALAAEASQDGIVSGLNGWQRLGIVLSVLWLLIANGIALFVFEAKVNPTYFALALWLPVALLWSLGWALSWIIAGFKQSR